MQLKSVDKPKASPFESAMESAPMQPREIISASSGQTPSEEYRAANQFLVRGTRERPLSQPPRNVFESLLTDVDRRKQILETDLLPWRMLCSLDIVSQNGLGYVGTGWFAGPRTLITAGHCVYDEIELGGWARQITVIPGRNGDSGSDFPRAHVECRFRRVLMLDAPFRLRLSVGKLGRTSIRYDFHVFDRDEELAIEGSMTVVVVQNGKPTEIPPTLRAALNSDS